MTKVMDTFKTGIVCTLLVFSILMSALTLADDPVFEESGIPEGFELLASPQLTIVDVYYGDRYIASVKAVYSPSTLEFLDPEYLAGLLPNVSKRELLQSAISGPLDRHDEWLCHGNEVCETFKPDVAGIIFDESLFRLTLKINPDMLDQAPEFARRYLPPSTADKSFLQTANLLFTGHDSDEREETWTLFGRSLYAFNESNLESLWDYDKERHLGIRTLALNKDKEGFIYGIGLLQNRGFGLTFSADHTIVGARIGSSLRTLEDNGLTQSSRLPVFRATRGRIEVFRDGRLIHSEFQEAGNQLINTNNFPSGAYNITIKSYDGDLLLQEEQRFFVKTTFLPPTDEPQYFIEAGKPMNVQSQDALPDSQNGGLVRAGYSQRLGENSSLSFAAAATDKEVLGELSWLWLNRHHQTSSSAMIADHGRYGVSIYSYLNLSPVNINLNYRKLWSNARTTSQGSDDYLLLNDGYYQASVSAGLPVGKGSIDFRRNYHRDDKARETSIIDGISYDTPLWHWSDYQVRFRTDLSRDNDQLRILAGIELHQRVKHWITSVGYQAEYNRTELETHTISDRNDHYKFSTTWSDKDLYADDIAVDLHADRQNDRFNTSTALRYGGRFFDSSFTISQTRFDDDSERQNTISSWSGGINSSLITNGDSLAFGGKGNAESGLLVKLNGQVKGSFDILVNGQRKTYATIGNSTLINLSPFETYKVFIRPRGEAYYEYDERELEFTLYPGNVQSLSWDIEQVLVVIGQLENQAAKPLANATLKGIQGLSETDEDGRFQARISTGVRHIEVTLPDDKRCTFSLPEKYLVKRGVVLAGSMICD